MRQAFPKLIPSQHSTAGQPVTNINPTPECGVSDLTEKTGITTNYFLEFWMFHIGAQRITKISHMGNVVTNEICTF
jgi:hypothetical protein